MRTGEGAGDRLPGGGGLGGSPCSSRKASRSTYSTSPNGSVRSHSSGASRLGPGAAAGRPRGDPPPTTAPDGASSGPAVSRPGPGTVAVGRTALRSFSFRRPGGQGKTGQGGGGEEERDGEETPSQRHEEKGDRDPHSRDQEKEETDVRRGPEKEGKDPEREVGRDSEKDP